MDTPASDGDRPLKGKVAVQGTISNTSHNKHAPMSFVLRSESDMAKSMGDNEGKDEMEHAIAASASSTSFGVQSLEDAMQISEETLSASPRATHGEPLFSNSILAGLKRKPGNPVHPKIYATGQRIVSSDLQSSLTSSLSSSPPKSSSRHPSVPSSMHLPPLNISPQPEGLSPGTPRTNSMKSFRLSDEEVSIASDTGSQAIQSSSSEDEALPQMSASITSGAHRESELIMPSLAVPARRPFTDRGRAIGQMKVMVVGRKGVGKTSLLRSIFKHSEDIVHIDGMSAGSSMQASSAVSSGLSSTATFVEYQASTKPYPLWWTESESGRAWWRRKSIGEGILERNLCFVDTPGVNDRAAMRSLIEEMDIRYGQLSSIDKMQDNQLLDLLSGRSDNFYDAVFYLFDHNQVLSDEEAELLRDLCNRSNLIPLLAHTDKLEPDQILTCKERIWDMLEAAQIDFCSMSTLMSFNRPHRLTRSTQDIFAVSSLIDDGDIMDASTLMASDYLPPLANSDLHVLIPAFFEPSTTLQLRHQSILKFIKRRRQHKRGVPRANTVPTQEVISTGSFLEEPSKVLVHGAYSSYYRSTSPSSSDASELLFGAGIAGHSKSSSSVAQPSRNIHIAKWARDLRRSLRMDNNDDLFTRPAKGRLGGELGIIDPKDPLGILTLGSTFGRRGLFFLQILTGCGLISAAAWWLSRNWLELQEWMWPSQSYSPVVVGPPAKSWMHNLRLF